MAHMRMRLSFQPDEPNSWDFACHACSSIYPKKQNPYLNNINPCCCSGGSSTYNNCLSATSFSAFTITDIIHDAEDTNVYTFKFLKKCDGDTKDCKLIYEPGQYFEFRGDMEKGSNNFIIRPYAVFPTNKDPELQFRALIRLVSTSAMYPYINKLKVGDKVYWRGPFGDFRVNYNLKHILMIVQGTGIAPVYGIINKFFKNPENKTDLKLFFCCKDHKNIHLRDDIHGITNSRFDCEIYLGEETEKNFLKKSNERITCKLLGKEEIKAHLDTKERDNYQILLCGANEFNQIMLKFCKQINISDEFIKVF